MPAAKLSPVPVGLGELRVSRRGELIAYSLGSCVAICLYDPQAGLSAMAHVVLPEAPGHEKTLPLPAKYADSAVPALLAALKQQGSACRQLRCKIAGGAAVLALGGGSSLLRIGERNIEAVKVALARAGLVVSAEATGGHQGRTVRMEAASGRVFVRTTQGMESEL
jgi:chemotaxis protein CheD